MRAALGQFSNWRSISSGQDYAALFDAPSPLLHLWSLSVEAQCYLVVPVLLVVLGRWGGRRLMGLGIASALAASLTAAVLVSADTARLYYGTDVRAAELLVGALLATALAAPQDVGRRWRSAVAAASVPALLTLLVTFSVLGLDVLRIDRGHLMGVAVASAVVVAASVLEVGPVARVLAWAPLRALGRISYALYLVHWPVFVALTPARTGWSGLSLLTLRLVVSLGLSVAVFVLVERPLALGSVPRVAPRRGMVALQGRVGAVAALASVAAVVALPAVLPASAPTGLLDLAAASDDLAQLGDGPGEGGRPDRVRIAVVGDSQAIAIGFGLRTWGVANLEVVSSAESGCGIGRGGRVRYHTDERAIFDDCPIWEPDFVDELRAEQPDLVLVVPGPWDFADRKLDGDEQWRSPGDDVYDFFLLHELLAANDRFAAAGVPVVWLTAPPIAVGRLDVVVPPHPADDPERAQGLNELVRVAASRRDASVVDYAAFLATCPDGVMDADIRPDGVHLTRVSGVMVAEWLGPELLDLVGAPNNAPQRTDCVSRQGSRS